MTDPESPQGVVMIGTFPPPVYGASKNNELLRRSLVEAGVETTALNTAATGTSLRRSALFHAQRILRNLDALYQVVRLGSKDRALYLVPNGGAGILYTAAQLGAAASRYGRVMLHHRTFRYIDHRSPVMALLVKTLPRDTRHVFLSDGMARLFQKQYGPVETMVASNARFVSAEAACEPQPRSPGPLRIGHLSNLCQVKGFHDVVASFESVRDKGVSAQLHLAGPIIEPEVRASLDRLTETYGADVRWFGELSGEAKRDFYRSLDVFLFPTRYDKEAAPNVVYEALAAGVPTIAASRGCIGEIVFGPRGLLVDDIDRFPALAADYIAALALSDLERTARSGEIKRSVAEEAALSQQQYGALLAFLGADRGAAVSQEF